MESIHQARRRLHAAGIDFQSDQGGGFELYRDKQRIGRVFSEAALISWREEQPEPEPTRPAPWPEQRVFPVTKWIAGELCWCVFGTAAAGCPRYEPVPELTELRMRAVPVTR